MYTIKDGTTILGVSKVTLYKHMEKNAIAKGKKLTDEDLNILKKSIEKTKSKVKGKGSTDFTKSTEESLLLIKELEKKCDVLEKENILFKNKLENLEKDNREMISQLQNSQIMSNSLIAQNIELVRETRLLLSPNTMEKNVLSNEKNTKRQKDKETKKKWWQR